MPEFDEKYVAKLREEAAQWRTKLRELEAQNLYKDVEVEFAKRGIQADPTWVEVKEGEDISKAVDALVSKHPNLAGSPAPTPTLPTTNETPEVRRPQLPRVMQAGPKHSDNPDKPFHERAVSEIKKDPVARSKLRDLYRAKLAASSNQPQHDQ